MKSIILIGIIAAAAGVYVLLQLQKTSVGPASRPLAVEGAPAPEFALPGLDGATGRLSDYRGKVVFLNIWATWCAPCREEMPSMQKLYQEMKGLPFEILAVSIDILGAKTVGPFMEELKLSFPALLDPQGTIGRLYGTTGVPETFIINQQGIITAKVIGARNWSAPEAIKTFKNLVLKQGGELRSSGSLEPATTKPPGDKP
ncbi:MAG: TlpA disulfide reductase family protein [Desulfosarcinaceae bacterium]